jgi:hypothetical protein
MAKSFLIDPDGVKHRLQQRYRANHRRWLGGDGSWPVSIPLGIPNEQQAREQLAAVKTWQARWHEWRGEGEVLWVERRWPSLGTQSLPERVSLHNPAQVADWLGETERWQRAERRHALMANRWPRLAGVLPRHFDVLADYPDVDFHRLFAMLEWLASHPDSGLYVRQLPVRGVDTKWLSARKSLVAGLLSAIRGEVGERADFHDASGIHREPVLIRFRLLDADMRRITQGLGDITAPLEEIARLVLPLRCIYIVENLQTGLAFGEIPEAAVFMRLGYAVDLFGEIPWLKQLPCYYWGDLDTHGFAILNRLRHYLPHTQSLLMDETTLLDHKDFWGQEDKPVVGADLSLLTVAEQGLYRNLCDHRWGRRVRLEQERVPWEYAWKRLCEFGVPQ